MEKRTFKVWPHPDVQSREVRADYFEVQRDTVVFVTNGVNVACFYSPTEVMEVPSAKP